MPEEASPKNQNSLQNKDKSKKFSLKLKPLKGILLLVVFCLIVLFTLVVMFVRKEKEESLRMELETEKGRLQASIEEKDKEIERLKEELDKLNTEKVGLESDLSKLNLEKKDLQEELEILRKKIKDMSKKSAETKTLNKYLEEKLSQLNSTLLKMMEEIANLKKELKITGDLSSLKEKKIKSELAQINPGLEGFIWTVNDVHNFVVISVGKKDGVKEGMIFDVFSKADNRKIGKIEVKNVRDTMSIADIIAKVRNFQKGDKIKFSLPSR